LIQNTDFQRAKLAVCSLTPSNNLILIHFKRHNRNRLVVADSDAFFYHTEFSFAQNFFCALVLCVVGIFVTEGQVKEMGRVYIMFYNESRTETNFCINSFKL